MSTEPIEELRERVTEILGEPNEAVVDALLVFATNEVARIAGGEMTARWQAEDAVKALEQRMRKALDDAEWGGPDRADAVADIREAVFGAPHSSAEPVSPASTPTGATGGAGEAQEARE